MPAYILRRILSGLFILWGVYTLTFLAVNLAPGDPFTAKENPKVQEEDLARLRAQWGYDRPVVARYLLHLRKMFWKDAEVLEAEGGGVAFAVRAQGGVNRVQARLIEPASSLTLVPTRRSAADDGAVEVRVAAGPDGRWPEVPLGRGRYQIGLRFLTVGDSPVAADVLGLALRVEGGRLRVAPSRPQGPGAPPPPERLVLVSAGGAEVVLPRGPDGLYGPVAAAPDAYTFRDPAASEPVSLAVPEEPLDEPGLTFSLGESVLQKRPVVEHLKGPLLNTLILATAALVVQFLVGVLLGVVSAVRRGGLLDGSLTLTSLFLYSMPVFWLAVMLQLLFAIKLDALPLAGMHDVDGGGLADLLEHLVLPTLVLGVGGAASTARYQRSAMLEVLSQDYVRTARAKGLSERSVIWRHALRNALLPTITLLGLSLPFLVSGSVITEQIFSWPGMGREAVAAIGGRDVFVVTGITLIATAMVVVGSLLADILYAVVDPRVRLQ